LNASICFCLTACATSPSSRRKLYPSLYKKSWTTHEV
jgi:hypothetical protein